MNDDSEAGAMNQLLGGGNGDGSRSAIACFSERVGRSAKTAFPYVAAAACAATGLLGYEAGKREERRRSDDE